jgi:hypothetical protein
MSDDLHIDTDDVIVLFLIVVVSIALWFLYRG